jgi:L-fucose isomerase-like protein
MNGCTLGVIIGNRDFFPDHLVNKGRRELLEVLRRAGIDAVILDEKATKFGAVETYADARRCAELFRRERDRIDGILVSLPNFGDEKGVLETIKQARLDAPVLVQAFPDDMKKMAVEDRRDSFCGKLSVTSNLRQANIPFSLTALHTVHPSDVSFAADLERFTGVCRVVRGLRGARLGAIGARPNAFNTVRYSEKILEANGISVSTVDLSEILAQAVKLAGQPAVKDRLEAIKAYADTSGVPSEALQKMAQLAAAIDEWMQANDLQASAFQCWTSIQQNYGVNPCAVMSMMSQQLAPCACEVDVTGALTMYAMQLASGTPSALADWNNNYADQPDKCVLFHCGNWASCFLDRTKMRYSDILAGTQGKDKTYGALAGRTRPGPVTVARLSTEDDTGRIRGYVAEGTLTDDPLETFGSCAVVHVSGLQELLRYICLEGFEHHVAMNLSSCSQVLSEALTNYMGWDLYVHPDQK